MNEIYKRVNKYLNTFFKSDEEINWKAISYFYKLSEDFIEEFQDKVDWWGISRYQTLSESFMEKYLKLNKLFFKQLACYQNLSEEFMKKYLNRFYKSDLIKYQNLSEDFIRYLLLDSPFLDYWSDIYEYQNLSENFIRNHIDKVNWLKISKYQKLSESFIEEFQNNLIWGFVSESQILSESFIEKWKDKLDWNCISKYQPINKLFIEKWKDKLNPYLIKYNYLSKNKIDKKDWFIAYVTKFSITKSGGQSFRFSLRNYGNLFNYKTKIFYKDLILTNKCNKINILRPINKYKIFNEKRFI